MPEFLVTLIPLCPLLACLAITVLGPTLLKEKSHWLTVLGNAGAFICALMALIALTSTSMIPQGHRTFELYKWMSLPASAARSLRNTASAP